MLNGKEFQHEYYNIKYTHPLLFNIDREEVALIVFDQLFFFNPRLLSFTKQFTIPLPNIAWHLHSHRFDDVLVRSHSGIVDALTMLSHSEALIRFTACNTNVIMNIDTGYVVGKFESQSLSIYLGDYKILVGCYDIYDIKTHDVIASIKCNARITHAILLADNQIGVWYDCNLDIYRFDQKVAFQRTVQFTPLTGYFLGNATLIDHSKIAVTTIQAANQ
jgi:hypothetical protein